MKNYLNIKNIFIIMWNYLFLINEIRTNFKQTDWNTNKIDELIIKINKINGNKKDNNINKQVNMLNKQNNNNVLYNLNKLNVKYYDEILIDMNIDINKIWDLTEIATIFVNKLFDECRNNIVNIQINWSLNLYSKLLHDIITLKYNYKNIDEQISLRILFMKILIEQFIQIMDSINEQNFNITYIFIILYEHKILSFLHLIWIFEYLKQILSDNCWIEKKKILNIMMYNLINWILSNKYIKNEINYINIKNIIDFFIINNHNEYYWNILTQKINNYVIF